MTTQRQTLLSEFRHAVLVRYVPMRRCFLERKGLAERELKTLLERRGWTVWRGELVGILRRAKYDGEELYPNVRTKYELLGELLERHHPETKERLEYLAAVHHGLPDFLCFRLSEFRFVECKLGHEQLRRSQKRCIPKLLALGFDVEVHVLVDGCTKARVATLDLKSGRRCIREQQLALTKKLCETHRSGKIVVI